MKHYFRSLLSFIIVVMLSTPLQAQTTLTTSPLSVTAACPGTTIVVSFSLTGPYSINTAFTVQVSDGGEYRDIPTGPVYYGSTLYASMPADLPAGVIYTFRVRAANPAVIGTASPTKLLLKGNGIRPALPKVDSLVVTCQSLRTGSDAAHYASIYVYTALGATPRLYSDIPTAPNLFIEEIVHTCTETAECRRYGTFQINKVGFYSYTYVYPVNERTFYVSQLVDGCESDRVPVLIRILFEPGAGPRLTNQTDGANLFGNLAYCQGEKAYPLDVNGHGPAPENYRVVYNGVDQYGRYTPNTRTLIPPIPDTSVPNKKSYVLSYEPIDPSKGCAPAPQNNLLFPTLTVTVNPQPAKPTATTSVINYYQGQSSTPLSATTTDSTATLVWYGNATGGTGSTIAPQPPTSQAGQFTYYVAQKAGTCESERVPIQVMVNPLLGVDDPSLTDAVDIFPNPIVSTLTVRIRGLSTHQSAQVELIDLQGQVILHQETQRETSVLTLDDYPKGSYLLLINVGNRRASRRVVKL